MFEFFIRLVCVGGAFLLGIGVMVYGWGLTPVSWWWIVGGWLGAVALLAVNNAVDIIKKGL